MSEPQTSHHDCSQPDQGQAAGVPGQNSTGKPEQISGRADSRSNFSRCRWWVAPRRLEPADKPLQPEMYFALDPMTDTVAAMLDNL